MGKWEIEVVLNFCTICRKEIKGDGFFCGDCGPARCKCGAHLSDGDITLLAGENEEGEEYTEIGAKCWKCGERHNTFAWGEVDKKGAHERLRDYIQNEK